MAIGFSLRRLAAPGDGRGDSPDAALSSGSPGAAADHLNGVRAEAMILHTTSWLVLSIPLD
jgi:hypothetical protein